MATLLSLGGNWSSASSWALCDASAEIDVENLTLNPVVGFTESPSWSYVSSPPTVDGLAIKFKNNVSSPTGTLTVHLTAGGTEIAASVVTVNIADLNTDTATSGIGWHFFKFSSSITLSTSVTYTAGVKITGTASAPAIWCSSSTSNFSKQLRTTATQVPVAGDKVIVAGELTGAATGNDKTITLDGDQSAVSLGSTALLQSVHVSKRGILSYSTSAAANPKLKWKGVFGVYGGGTLNVGTSGTAIPSTSTAELIMDCAANVDSGLVINNGAVVNLYGNPITNVRANLGNGYSSFTPNSTYGGLCNTSGTTITTTSGPAFTAALTHVWVAGVLYKATYVDSTHATVTNVAPTYASSGVTVPTYTGAAYLAVYNLYPGAESFSSWLDVSAGTTTLTSGQTDPLSGTTAFKLVGNNGNTWWTVGLTALIPIDSGIGVSGRQYTITFWAKTDTSATLDFILQANSISTTQSFTLNSTWTQYTATLTVPANAVSNQVYAAFNLKNAQNIYLWRPQLVPGSSAPPFYTPASAFPTTGDIGGYANTASQTAGGAAGYLTTLQGQGLSGLSGNVLLNNVSYPITRNTDNGFASLLIAPGGQSSVGYVPSSNLSLNTDDWLSSNLTTTKSALAGPSGAVNAVSIANNATSGFHSFTSASNNNINVVSGTVYTFSMYVKYSNHQWVALRSDSTSAKYASFDLLNGVVGAVSASASSAITSVGGGWYRISLTWTASSTVVSTVVLAMNNADVANAASYAGTGTLLYAWGPMVNTGSSPGTYQTTFATDISTGWKSGDLIALAPTSRTFTDCEYGTLAADASGTSCTIAMSLVKPHTHMGEFGISGMNCEILNLSRNIKIHGNSGALQGYIVVNSTAVVTLRYAEFYWLGAATTSKRGLDIATTTGTFDCQYCALHDFIVTSSRGFNITGTSGQTASTLIVSNNNTFNIDDRHFIFATTSGLWTVNNNVFMRNTSGGSLCEIADVSGIWTNNSAIACGVGSQAGFLLNENNIVGTFSGNTAHSNATYCFQYTSGSIGALLVNLLGWRVSSAGLVITSHRNLTVSNSTFVSCTANIQHGNGNNGVVLTNVSASADVVFGSVGANGITSAGTNLAHGGVMVAESCSFGVAQGLRSNHGVDISIGNGCFGQIQLLNSTLGSTAQASLSATFVPGSFVAAQRLNGVAGNHKFWMPYGTGAPDTVIFKAASPSLRLTPSNASNKLESAPPGGYGMKAAVASGGTIAVSVWVRKSISTDASGANYNGNQQRLIVRKNVAAGIAADTVLATASAAVGTWEQLTGTTAAVTDDAVLEFILDCDGTAGWTNLDDWTVA